MVADERTQHFIQASPSTRIVGVLSHDNSHADIFSTGEGESNLQPIRMPTSLLIELAVLAHALRIESEAKQHKEGKDHVKKRLRKLRQDHKTRRMAYDTVL